MKISIVIPVYNEAEYLDACLGSIAALDHPPLEVIVVDNNSTDNSAKVAAKYDFVTVVREPRQGVVHARTTGFNAATGDIIGRIDADTILPSDWTSQVAKIMKNTDVAAVSGAALYCDMALADVSNQVDLYFRRKLAVWLKGNVYLWGANMAIRRQAWQQVTADLCLKRNLHEDFDLAIHLQRQGEKVIFDDQLQAYASSRRIDTGFLDFLRYVLVSPKTYAAHRIKSRHYMYIVVMVCLLFYLPGRILHRGYNPIAEKFSWRYLFTRQTSPSRVDPTSNVA